MNWEAIGAVGEILGALGVIITLAYLAMQIRGNTKIARSSTRQAIAESAQALSSDLLNDGEIAEIFVRHISGERLQPAEIVRLHARAYRDMRHFENIHYQLREGLFAEKEWQGFRRQLVLLTAIPVYREYWHAESSIYSDAFQKEMESILLDAKQTTTRGMRRFGVSPDA